MLTERILSLVDFLITIRCPAILRDITGINVHDQVTGLCAGRCFTISEQLSYIRKVHGFKICAFIPNPFPGSVIIRKKLLYLCNEMTTFYHSTLLKAYRCLYNCLMV